jgi:hypothetical protein
MELFTGKAYLQMDIAASFGLDNKEWSVRQQWFNDHEHELMDMLPQAKEPALFFAGVQAWEDVKAGKASGYPISLDATCSGLQILAALTCDRSSAELCNVVSTGRREDAYTSIYQFMADKLGEGAKIDRSKTKTAIMTSLYGSEAEPKKVFGEGILLYTFYEMMQLHCPGAWDLNQFYLQIWNPEALVYNWVLPDNWHVRTKVMGPEVETVHFDGMPFDITTQINRPTEKGRSLGANTTHSIDGMIVREMARRCMYDRAAIIRILNAFAYPATEDYDAEDENAVMVRVLWNHYEKTGYLSARILDHLASENVHLVNEDVVRELIDSLPEKPFEVISIHDCFRCLPNYGNDLRKQYNLQLHLIAKSNLLSSILSQLMGQEVEIGKLDPTMIDQILEADYALC